MVEEERRVDCENCRSGEAFKSAVLNAVNDKYVKSGEHKIQVEDMKEDLRELRAFIKSVNNRIWALVMMMIAQLASTLVFVWSKLDG